MHGALSRFPTETITGRATYQIVGSSNGIDEQLYGQLSDVGLQAKAPVVEGYLTVGADGSDSAGRPLRLLGIDPFAEAPFRGFTSGGYDHDTPGFGSLLTRPATVSSYRAKRLTAMVLALAIRFRLGRVVSRSR